MKPVVALDFDEIMFPFIPELIEWVNPLRSWNLRLEDFHSFDFNKVWGGTPEEAFDLVGEFFDQLDHLPDPVDGSVEAIEQLSKSFSLIVVTARHDQLRDATMSWIAHHFPETFHSVHLCNLYGNVSPPRPKADVCNEFDAIALVDDSLSNTAAVAATGRRGVLFGNYPWNQSDQLPSGVVRATTWGEVAHELEQLT